MPLTPEANLGNSAKDHGRRAGYNILDKLFGLDIAHPMNTGNTVTVVGNLSVQSPRTIIQK